MLKLKRYNEYRESVTFEEEVEEDGMTISAYIDGKYIGKVVIVYIMNGYREFEHIMSEDRYYELFPDDRYAEIQYLAVNTDYTGEGYAKTLMKKALENIKESGEKKVYLNASPMSHKQMHLDVLVNFYEKFGFEIVIDEPGNKEMILTLENASSMGGPNQTLKTIDSFLKVYADEKKLREDERDDKEKAKREEEEEQDIIVDEFDEETPELTDKATITEPSRKHNSLGQGATNMP